MTDPAEPDDATDPSALDARYVPLPTFVEFAERAATASTKAWTHAVNELNTLKASASTASVLDRALDVAMRAAAFDTGAIEGLYNTTRGITITVATQAHMWEQRVAQIGDQAPALFAAQLRAYELVLDIATQSQPVTQVVLRRLHEELTEPQETYTVHTPVGVQQHALPRGEYKTQPNHVMASDGSVHVYAPVGDTGSEMGRLVDQIASEEFAAAHASLQAAYAHWALTYVHPFADGNGRVARALASVYSYRAASVPLLILADEREAYFDALEAADDRSYSRLVAFILRAAVSALKLVSESLRTAQASRAEDHLTRLDALTTAQGGLSHQQLDGVAVELLDEANALLHEHLQALSMPVGVRYELHVGQGAPTSQGVTLPDGYRNIVQGANWRTLVIQSATPADGKCRALFGVFVEAGGDEDAAFVLRWKGTREPAELALALWDVHPKLSLSAHHRLRLFFERVVADEMRLLLEFAQASLTRAGYAPSA